MCNLSFFGLIKLRFRRLWPINGCHFCPMDTHSFPYVRSFDYQKLDLIYNRYYIFKSQFPSRNLFKKMIFFSPSECGKYQDNFLTEWLVYQLCLVIKRCMFHLCYKWMVFYDKMILFCFSFRRETLCRQRGVRVARVSRQESWHCHGGTNPGTDRPLMTSHIFDFLPMLSNVRKAYV